MPSKRYTIIVADRSSGVVRRATVSLRPVLVISGLVLSVPVLIGIGAAWKAKSDVANLEASHRALELENASFRSATDELTTQITSLEAAIRDIGARSALDPNVARTMDKLPALVKASAMGGSTEADRTAQRTVSSLGTPEDTFGLLRTLLESLESRLSVVSRFVDRRNALAAATPSIWPARGCVATTTARRSEHSTETKDAQHRPRNHHANTTQQTTHTANNKTTQLS